MKIFEGMWYCSVCGSVDVQIKEWTSCNSGHSNFSSGDDLPLSEQWCCDCEEHTKLNLSSEEVEIKFCIKRDGEDISLNAGLPDYLLNEENEVLIFNTREDAKNKLLRSMTEEQIYNSSIEIEIYKIEGANTNGQSKEIKDA